MVLKRINLLLLIVTLLVAVGIAIWATGNLPARVPIHFNASGVADRWSSRMAFLLLFGVEIFFAAALLPFFGMMIRSVPTAMINIPNKQYWLDDPHRDSTLGFISSVITLVGIVTAWLMISIFYLSSLVALERIPDIVPAIYLVLAGYMALVFGICIWMWVHFVKIPDTAVQAE